MDPSWWSAGNDEAAHALAGWRGAMSLPLLLASASPRRRELLERIGLAIEVHPANVDERAQDGEAPEAYVARIARSKAIAIARRNEHWVLAADTTVTLDGAILGKAGSPEEATKMLRWLSGRTHQVLTAFVLVGERDGKTCVREGLVSTDVVMIDAGAAMLADYVASGEWRGKAGAYAIQGIGAALVSQVRGSVTNVIGLPLAQVIAALREVGGPLPRFAAGTPA
jgi:septum formation protein